MKPLLSVAFALTCLIVTATAVKADFCVVPELPEAVSTAKLVFSGRIVDVSQVQANARELASSSDYIVTFEVEQWWKGTGTHNIEVLWRTSLIGCSYFPVGNIGDRYLVYADVSTRIVAGKDGLLEISISNRTSKSPATPPSAPQLDLANRKINKSFLNLPEINRSDASGEIEVLRQLRECDCFSGSVLACMGSPGIPQPEEREDSKRSNSSTCCECMRRLLRPFSSGR